MPNEHRADPTPPPHHGQGRGGSKKESFSLRMSPALHPPGRLSPRRADMAGHGLGRETRERRYIIILIVSRLLTSWAHTDTRHKVVQFTELKWCESTLPNTGISRYVPWKQTFLIRVIHPACYRRRVMFLSSLLPLPLHSLAPVPLPSCPPSQTTIFPLLTTPSQRE